MFPFATKAANNNKHKRALLYSVDVYHSLRDREYIAVSSYPITAEQMTSKPKVRPYTVGTTADQALDDLQEVITQLTGRKDLGLLSVRYSHKYVCVDCENGSVMSFQTKQELIEHRKAIHALISDGRYIRPANAKDNVMVFPW